MKAIVAVNEDWAIGYKGDLLYRIKEDLQNFKKVTSNHPVIYSRKTLETFPGKKPLPNRKNIILSSNKDFLVPGAVVAHSVKECLDELGEEKDEAFCIGGASVYEQFLPYINEIYVTMVYDTCKADSFFPVLSEMENWELREESEGYISGELKYNFRVYEKVAKKQIFVGVINGSGGSGKSTFCTDCAYAVRRLSKYKETLRELSSVSWPKKVAKFAGWDGISKTEKDRKFLSDLNIALEEWNDSPLTTVIDEIALYSKLGTHYFMVNIREPWRIERFKKICEEKGYKVITILVTNPNVPRIFSNIGDASVMDYEYNYEIENNGTLDDLMKAAFDLMEEYCGSKNK